MQNNPNRQVMVEKIINEFLREDVGSTLLASIERLAKAINAEANKNILGEDWIFMQNYVQWCYERLRPSKKM
jgi:hypothetical protein